MRYSTEPGDPGYERWCAARKQGRNPRFFLDGKQQQYVTIADEDAGFIVKLREPLKIGPGRQWVRIERRGSVKVEA
jgi:hypothetical protein